MKKASKTYKVWYDKRVGGVGHVIVKAQDPNQALKNAKYSVATGSNFRNPKKVDGRTYKKPRKQGFAGRD
jgi:hypothetical protein